MTAYKLGAQDSIADAAHTIRQAILNAFEHSEDIPWPPTAQYLLNMENGLPEELQKFLNIVLCGKKNDTNSRINRLVMSIGEDLCRAITRGKWKMPKHILLCLTLRHLFRSKELTILMNRLGHCEGYDFALELETAIANSVREAASVLSQQIVTDPCRSILFHSEFDNFDQFINELTGKGSVHTAHFPRWKVGMETIL